MTKIAIPTFQKRVSPVFDTCKHMLVINCKNGSEVGRESIFLDNMTLNERCRIFENLGVSVIICGGISEAFGKILKRVKIELTNGIAGEVEDVLSAYLGGCLDTPKFYMPGFNPNDERK
ncbi:NifB/NifX family molybdenum-iron cluster-binding protein [uncultured Desulfosarcina sp.]|uniref:NifB/NifX family molybdenum-iron cluster-binding protein n=1 Tax=uncultured Desulfosarcina sp. TaxID=218289 RepID=UPI0029C78BF4|nr:NifB/NifX family molybdenum-iron cluster-binding protein [uncultured Desulfosarcina sp.]